MPTRKTPAVVINVRDYGESDKIVTFYGVESGKVSGIAKGAKRSKKRFLNKLELFSLLNVTYNATGRTSLVRIDQAELVDSFSALRKEYEMYVTGHLLCELINNWAMEGDSDENLFSLLIWALKNLNKGQPCTKILILFHIKMFDFLGFRPQLSACMECNRVDPQGTPYRFKPNRNGILCSRCNNEDSSLDVPLSINTAKILRKAQELPQAKLDRLNFSQISAKEAMNLLRKYGLSLLRKDIHSWKYVSGIRNQRAEERMF